MDFMDFSFFYIFMDFLLPVQNYENISYAFDLWYQGEALLLFL